MYSLGNMEKEKGKSKKAKAFYFFLLLPFSLSVFFPFRRKPNMMGAAARRTTPT
jgi:hypothetical protein